MTARAIAMTSKASAVACVVFVFAAATDFIDGYIARRYGLVTVVGRILDPFVDKVIIGAAQVPDGAGTLS